MSDRPGWTLLPGNAGLCRRCRHARLLTSKRSAFLRCGLSDGDPEFPRYPRLPVVACRGFEEGGGSPRGAAQPPPGG